MRSRSQRMARALVAMTMLFLGCGGGGGGSRSQPSARADSAMRTDANATLRRAYGELVAPGETREAVAKRFGQPRVSDVEEHPNRHVPGAVDTIVTWRYPTREFSFIVASGREFLLASRLVVRGRSMDALPAEAYGLEAAQTFFGVTPATTRRADTTILVYPVPSSEPGAAGDVLNFCYVDGRLAAIVAIPYVD